VLVCTDPDAMLGDYTQTRRFATTDQLVSALLPMRVVVADLFAGAPDTTL
jgi:hypothetical protein